MELGVILAVLGILVAMLVHGPLGLALLLIGVLLLLLPLARR